jgi:hypothetical protein
MNRSLTEFLLKKSPSGEDGQLIEAKESLKEALSNA